MQQQQNKSNKKGERKRLMKFKKKMNMDFMSAMRFVVFTIVLCLFIFVGNVSFAYDEEYYGVFDSGSNQYLTITDASQTGLEPAEFITIEAWVRPDSTSDNMTIASKWGTAGNKGYTLIMNAGATDSVNFRATDNGSTVDIVSASYSFTTGVWTHIAAACEFSGAEYTCDFYQDASFISTGTGTGGTTSMYNSSAAFRIGQADDGGVYKMDGAMDEVRIWSTQRTSTDIDDYYDNCDLDVTASGLEGYFRMENDWTDDDANGNDMTAINSPTFGTTTLPFTCSTSTPTSTPSVVSSTAMPIENDIGVITGYVEIYTDSTSTPSEIRKIYYHVPFFVWYVIFSVSMFIIARLYSILSKNEKK